MHKSSNPQVYGGLQRGKILARGIIHTMNWRELYDVDLNDIDCSTQLAIDVSFDINLTPTAGHFVLYRKSAIMRTIEPSDVRYYAQNVLTFTDVLQSIQLGIKPGFSIQVDTGFESFGLSHDLQFLPNQAIITNLQYVIRIVDRTVGFVMKGE
jgi:hypothetical protein